MPRISRAPGVNPYSDFQHVLFSVVDAPPDEVAGHLHHLRRELLRRRAYEHDPGGPPAELLNPDRYHLEPCEHDLSWAYIVRPTPGFQPLQDLLWEPLSNPGSTVMMTNRFEGGIIGRDLPWDSVRVLLRDRDPRLDPSYHLDYYADSGTVHRELCVARDDNDKWVFITVGSPQSFENLEYYNRRRKIDRLNRDVITEYLIALGYDITGDAFWTTDTQAWLLWDDFGGRKPAPTRHDFSD